MPLLGFLSAVLVACSIGLGLGGWSAWQALTADTFIDRTELGSWSAYSNLANPQNNPYAAAKAAQLGGLPLGLAEGFVFTASNTTSGQLLKSNCNYILSGTLPPARLWTLDAINASGTSLLAGNAPQAGMNSRSIVHTSASINDDVDALTLAIGPDAEPGNWMQIEPDQPFILVLRLYDTQVGSGVGVRDISLPRIETGRQRQGC